MGDRFDLMDSLSSLDALFVRHRRRRRLDPAALHASDPRDAAYGDGVTRQWVYRTGRALLLSRELFVQSDAPLNTVARGASQQNQKWTFRTIALVVQALIKFQQNLRGTRTQKATANLERCMSVSPLSQPASGSSAEKQLVGAGRLLAIALARKEPLGVLLSAPTCKLLLGGADAVGWEDLEAVIPRERFGAVLSCMADDVSEPERQARMELFKSNALGLIEGDHDPLFEVQSRASRRYEAALIKKQTLRRIADDAGRLERLRADKATAVGELTKATARLADATKDTVVAWNGDAVPPPRNAVTPHSGSVDGASRMRPEAATVTTVAAAAQPPGPGATAGHGQADTVSFELQHFPSKPVHESSVVIAPRRSRVVQGYAQLTIEAVLPAGVHFELQHYPLKPMQDGGEPVSNSILFEFDTATDTAEVIAEELADVGLIAECDQASMATLIQELLKKPELHCMSFKLAEEPIRNVIRFKFDTATDNAGVVAKQLADAGLVAECDQASMATLIQELLTKPELQCVSLKLCADVGGGIVGGGGAVGSDDDAGAKRPYQCTIAHGYAQLATAKCALTARETAVALAAEKVAHTTAALEDALCNVDLEPAAVTAAPGVAAANAAEAASNIPHPPSRDDSAIDEGAEPGMVVDSSNVCDYIRGWARKELVVNTAEQVRLVLQGVSEIYGGEEVLRQFSRGQQSAGGGWRALQQAIRGAVELDVLEWRAVTNVRYRDSGPTPHAAADLFWELIGRMPVEMKQKLLYFWCSEAPPAGGLTNLNRRLVLVLGDPAGYFEAHTCFFQLHFPATTDPLKMQAMLDVAVAHWDKFGLV